MSPFPKPRSRGITMVIDPGLPTGAFTDVVASHGDHIDLVKFGWGTALVTRDLDRKIAVLRETGIGFFFGGTLFERYLWRGQLDDYLALVEQTGAAYIEVSNGTIPLDQHRKAEYVRRMARYRPVLSEVGYKDPERSAQLSPADWVSAIGEDLGDRCGLMEPQFVDDHYIPGRRGSGSSSWSRPSCSPCWSATSWG